MPSHGPNTAAFSASHTYTRHTLAAFMSALGYTDPQIQGALSYKSIKAVRALKNSPLFKAEVDTFRAEIRDQLLTSFTDRLAKEAIPTLDRLVELRDQSDELKVSLGAAKTLLDRIAPRPLASSTPSQNLTIVLSQEQLAPALDALKELKQINSSPSAPPPPPPSSDQPPLPPSFEDAIESENQP